ncbi:MAG: wax ester/triacylglycerol synthase family O-acyltransferase [Candidatus Nanopelagicales bacterium]|jgi:WS/DGAT/MGAT family acyltransferase|nr:wax ester/triacylglycerol synthase family O-acyltransferase [Candidatus Nanopelagicales bacterium]
MTRHHMSAADSAWLRMDNPGNLLVINSIMWSSEPLDFEVLKKVIEDRMIDKFPRFRQKAVHSRIPMMRAEWEDDEAFDPERHYRYVTLPEPGDAHALQAYVSSQTGLVLDPDRPLWEVHFIDGFDQGAATLFRIHHAIADGISLMRVVLSLTDDGAPADLFHEVRDPSNTDVLRRTAEQAIGFGAGLVRHPTRVVGLAGTAVRDAARIVHLTFLPPKPKSVLSGDVVATKLVTWTPPIPLAEVKSIARGTGTTINDVMLTALSGGLGSYLVERGTPLDNVRVLVPVNLRPLDKPLPPELGNEFGFYFVDLPTSRELAVGERLAEMHRRVEEIKGSPEALVAFGVLAGLGAAPKLVEDIGVAFFGSKGAGVVTNVPGPREPVYLAGARVDGIIGWVPRAGDMGFGVSIFSYAGEMVVGFSTDEHLMPDPERMQELVLAELEALRGLAG